MAPEENKALVRRFYEEVFRKKNLAAVDQFIAADIVDHSAPPGAPQGLEGARQALGMFVAAFPDLDMAVEDMIAEGDRVAVRYTVWGTHRGEFMGIAPTGKGVRIGGMEVHRIAGGKLAEHWDSFDVLGMMQQLGVAPPPG